MGKQTDIKLRGTVENVIYYQWKGIYCMRTVPARVKQTKNTKKAATLFGVAVKNSAATRALLRPVLPDPASRTMMYDLDAVFRQWLHTEPLHDNTPADGLPSFTGLSFNKEARSGKLFKNISVSRAGDRNLVVKLPDINAAADITAPKGTGEVGLQWMAAVLPFDDETGARVIAADMMLPYIQTPVPYQEIILEGVTGPRCLLLLAMSMRFYKNTGQTVPINQVRWKPTIILAGFYN